MAQSKATTKTKSIKTPAPSAGLLAKLTKKLGKTAVWAGLISITLVLISAIGVFGYEYTYQNKVYPGVSFQGQNLGGQPYSAVADQVANAKTTIEEAGLTFTFEDHSVTLPVGPVEVDDKETPALVTIAA